jgi:predicted glycosyltransferase
MRFLFDILHPAHFHLFKNVIVALRQGGHEVEIIARQKDCIPELLEESGFAYHLIPRKKEGLVVLGWESIKAAAMAVRMTLRKRIDFMVGVSISMGPAARLTGSISLLFEDDDAKVVPVFAKLGYPIAHYVVTPRCLAFEDHGRKHLTYPGYHELAYLHPNHFTPNPDILRELGVKEGEKYFLIRLVSLIAHHDIGETGLTTEQAKIILRRLAEHGRVFISAEKTVDADLQKYLLPVPVQKIFDVLAFADLLVGDSQTMAAEAAVLGTPSIRCNTFKGRLSYLQELEDKYDLTKAFLPGEFDELLGQIDQWLALGDLKEQWRQKRQVMLDDCVDLTQWIFDLFEKIAKERNVQKHS